MNTESDYLLNNEINTKAQREEKKQCTLGQSFDYGKVLVILKFSCRKMANLKLNKYI